ncbi:MAG: hypothetical protein JXR84_09465, partial [Anaerolineae bacterium]|nr:hypothetical protein [Anaerolineae bacterium]
MFSKDSRILTYAATIGIIFLALITTYVLWSALAAFQRLEAQAAVTDYGISVGQTTTPSYFVIVGDRLTYTLSVENTHWQQLHLTITDTLPLHVTTDEHLAGTAILPGGELVWTPIITPSETWIQQIAVTVEVGYTGSLTNVVEITSFEGPFATSTHMNIAASEITQAYFPLIVKNYPRLGMLLVNPGFEGIGVPVDNISPVYDNWTRDTFTGVQYGEIYTPEGWVT